MDFLKIDLDEPHQPAIIRLRDDTINIVQAIFSDGGCALTCFGTDVETKRFLLSTDTMNVLHAAWTDYHGRVITYAAEKEQREEQAIAKAHELANSVQFDMESMHVEVKHDDYWGWQVTIPDPTIHFHNAHVDPEALPERVQAALDNIKTSIEEAEIGGWATNDYWKARVASYRRAFPVDQCQLCQKSFDLRELKKLGTGCDMLVVCDPCGQEELKRREAAWKQAQQGEPAEIVEARKLLTEAGIYGWEITPSKTEGNYDFIHYNRAHDGDVGCLDKPATELLNLVGAYIIDMQAPESTAALPE